jgi:glycine dehydrogenase subunit 2
MSKLIFETSVKGRKGVSFPKPSAAESAYATVHLPPHLTATQPVELPEVSELDVIRHYTRLSAKNFSIDTHFYPLGSCTMKYNPRICEKTAALDGFAGLHPLLPQLPQGETLAQGALEVIWNTEQILCELTGMSAFTLQPMAGAHGELTGLLLIAAYHKDKGNTRTKVIIPDSAHGTNPASASLAGYEVVSVPTDANGDMDLEAFRAALTPEIAAVMMTCPSTLGLFEKNILKIAELAHANDTLLYYDGANMNALMGHARPGDLGFDVVHLNVHKTFSTPHGGGGPGAGPVGVKESLIPFLPTSVVEKDAHGRFRLCYDKPKSIGYIAPFYGNYSVLIRAYTYLLHLGGNGLKEATDYAVLNANYIRVKLSPYFRVAYDRICMHECVFTADKQMEKGVRALDIAKALIDEGHHPPTIYFPLIVHEAMMFEPTETESRETLDRFIAAMIRIAETAEKCPESFATMPETTEISRVDETKAAKAMVLKA